MVDQQNILPPNPQSTPQPVATQSPSLFSWQASEYIHHHKPAGWYASFVFVAVVVAGLIYLVVRDYFTAGVVVLMFIALFVYAVRKPDTLTYSITDVGLAIGNRLFGFDHFRSFSVNQGSGVPTITFDPLKRLSPPISIFCEPDQCEKVSELLARFLPRADHEPDLIDRFSQYLRF